MKKVLAIFLSFAICLGQIPVNSVKAETSTNETRSSNLVTVRFDYTGDVQEFTAPYDGEYTLTVAGAQGGGCSLYPYYDAGIGGKGGTSTGKINLNKGQTIFIVVGGKGNSELGDGYSTGQIDGGYNGGGSSGYGYDGKNNPVHGESGGGATHIATTNRGELKYYESYKSELLLVAGGGGGAGTYNLSFYGGDGGGVEGTNGIRDDGASGKGGTQTFGGTRGVVSFWDALGQSGTFGQGGNGILSVAEAKRSYGAGGGGGFYGGGSSAWSADAGGGGSGYIGGVTDGSMTTGTNEGNGWATISYLCSSVTYDANGGVSSTDGSSTSISEKMEPNTTYTVKSGDMFKRTGYTFEGWNEVADGTGTYWKEGDTFSASDDKTLYALWSLITYNISYELNGGSITGEKTDYTVETDTFTLPTPTREGYTFTGWTGSNSTTPETSVSIEKGSTGHRNYTANWKANTYTVTYNANEGVSTDNTTTSISEDVDYDSEYTVKSGDIFKKTGYNFTGWNEEADGTGNEWVAGKTFTYKFLDGATLYAQWSLITYDITYDLNGGNISGEKTSYDVNTETFNLPTPTKEGYIFDGWTGSNGTTPEASVSVTKGSTGNRSYTANWTPINYSISYELDGGSISGEVTEYNIETDTFVLPMPTKPGYNFIGWTGSNGSTPETSVSVTKGSTGHKSYTANWELINYNITYDLAGGSVSGEKKSYTIETETFTLPTPTRAGYIFTGWTGTNGNTPEITVSIGKGSTGDRSYTANWRAITYTVKYSANSGTGTMEDSLHVYDNSLNSRENTFTKEGYRFDGWYASRVNENKTEWLYTNGSKKAWYAEDSQPEGYHKYKYSNGEAPFNITTKENDVITFNAQWIYDTVKVAVPQSLIGDKNGNSSFLVKSDIKVGSIALSTPDGFYYKQSGKEDVYAKITSENETTLTKQNQSVKYNVSSNGLSAGCWTGSFNIEMNLSVSE